MIINFDLLFMVIINNKHAYAGQTEQCHTSKSPVGTHTITSLAVDELSALSTTIIINKLMPVKQNSLTHLRVL
jgi:hypothetical protein